ncbi:aminotransferase class I/II-fold pyridoxal phosphate-dependent enzyme [Allostreptomyces psammosilenae]|uniref:DNA-binding transcriptional MocR family regulator n=1 Tax=Allostreptomyces psammosilenae TaxID=1892865 RepID=A0A852ZPQ8_9ACTN|nr:aminotransferase class I/II-fold pyridoxal phosphate-dependent enzyme [Allostreptomyces psammosilenae]NYI04436.1 DNA-binding transcriptional MocR family regulator [Allostreptomyces psammosilenae]
MSASYRFRGNRAAEIAADVERAVADGELDPGQSLPPLREVARELGVNPNTVAAAYRLLRDRGVVETEGRRGTRVRARPRTTARDQMRVAVPEGARDLSGGNPDPALLPSHTQALAAAARRYAERPVLYGAGQESPLLTEVARARFRAEGVAADHLAVTSGALNAVELLLSAWTRPGDGVAVEDPGWTALLDLLPALGLRTVPMAVDDAGPRVEAVEAALASGARALVLTARAHNPTGAAVTAERAERLRAVLAAHPDALLIEDDHGHGIAGVPLHTVTGAGPRWAAVRSAAKAQGPDLRVAAVAADRRTADALRGRQRLGAGWVSHLLQDTVAELWRAHDPERVRAVASAYDERRAGLVELLRRQGVAAHGRTGMNVWVPCDDETGAVTRLLARGWAVAPGARFRLRSPQGLRVTISPLRVAELPRLAEDLAEALRPRGQTRLG